MKSIIIGAGQPIVIPGQKNITNDVHLRQVTPGAQSAVKPLNVQSINETKSSLISNIFGKTDIRDAIPDLSHLSIVEQKVISVEEFCPDGEVLEKGFLDDVPSASLSPKNQQIYRQANSHPDVDDSDSDGNEVANPLVARFHDEPSNDNCIPQEKPPPTDNNTQNPPLKTNPLAKHKHKPNDFGIISADILTNRKSSMSSDDIEIPSVMKTPGSGDNSRGTDCPSNEEFDSWLSDTNQRRSPEGGEDIASLPSVDKTSVIDEPVDTVDNVSNSSLPKEKKHKSKKKKDKKDKHEKDESREKKKKKRRSKECSADDFLTGNDANNIHDDGAYEAI